MKRTFSGQFRRNSVETEHKNGKGKKQTLQPAIIAAFMFAVFILAPAGSMAGYCSYPFQGQVIKDNAITFVDTYEGEITRTFDYYIPPQLSQHNPQNQPPLVFIFHGHGASANEIFGNPGSAYMAYPWCRMMKEADRDGFIICAPEGWLSAEGLNSWNDCRKPSSKTPETNDVLFTQKLIAWFIDRGYNIDQNRMYAAGFSNGGGMVIRLAAEMDNHIAAVASVCALTPLLSYLTECTEPDETVSMLIMNGTEDPLVNDLYTQGLVDYCTDQNGLSASPRYVELPTDPANPENSPVDLWADLYRYESSFSFDPTSVFHYAVHEGGHCEPSRLEKYPAYYTETWGIGAGPQCYDFEVAEETWSFFKMHVLREERVYRPTGAFVVVGSGAGAVTDLWLNENSETNRYLVDDAEGTTMLAATFTIPDPQPIDSLRFTIVYRNTIAATHSISLWNYTSGASGSWEQIGSHTYTSPGIDATINKVVTDSLTRFINAQRQVTIALSSDSSSTHRLSVAMMEVGVTLKNLGAYAAGDTDYDGTVDGSDLCSLAEEYGKYPCTARCVGDCNDDDAVNAADVTVLAADLGGTML